VRTLGLARRSASEFLGLYLCAELPTFLGYAARCLVRCPEILRTRTLGPADAAMASRLCRFRVFGRSIRLPGDLVGLAREIYGRRVYFPSRDFVISPGEVVVDLGAHSGVFTILAALCGARTVAVEAQSGMIERLKANARRNACFDKIEVEFGMIGHRRGIVSWPNWTREASHAFDPPPVVTMPQVVARRGLGRIDFLKVDIEGSEFDLFSGEMDWLRLVRRVAMEVHPEHGDPSGLASALEERGFRVCLSEPGGTRVTRLPDARGGYLYAVRPGAGAVRP
jgi:FkbM family methyltransferase